MAEGEGSKFTRILRYSSGQRKIKSWDLDVYLKNTYTVHKDSWGGTSVVAPALKAAGCYMPPWLTNKNSTPLLSVHRTGEISFPMVLLEMWEASHLKDLSESAGPRVN